MCCEISGGTREKYGPSFRALVSWAMSHVEGWARGLGLVPSVRFLSGSGSRWSARLSRLPLLTRRARPVITVDVSIFLPVSINITAPQCRDGQQPVNCLNVTACFRFRGRHVPGEIGNEPPSQGCLPPSWVCRQRAADPPVFRKTSYSSVFPGKEKCRNLPPNEQAVAWREGWEGYEQPLWEWMGCQVAV